MSNVTVVSSVYGITHPKFLNRWWSSISRLEPQPAAVIVASDVQLRRLTTLVKPCAWNYPQPFYQQAAIEEARTEWVWICDIDDLAYPDALAGIEEVDADVWQMGYDRTDGLRYIPPQLSADEFLASKRNVFVSNSAIRRVAFHYAGGFHDVVHEDKDLWVRMAELGATFQSSGRAHFTKMMHPEQRTQTEAELGAIA